MQSKYNALVMKNDFKMYGVGRQRVTTKKFKNLLEK